MPAAAGGVYSAAQTPSYRLRGTGGRGGTWREGGEGGRKKVGDGGSRANPLNINFGHRSVHFLLGMCGIYVFISVWFFVNLIFGLEGVLFGSVQKNVVLFRYYGYLLLM